MRMKILENEYITFVMNSYIFFIFSSGKEIINTFLDDSIVLDGVRNLKTIDTGEGRNYIYFLGTL